MFFSIKLFSLSKFLLYSSTFCSPKNNGTLYQLIWFWGKIFPNTISIKQSQIPPRLSLPTLCVQFLDAALTFVSTKVWVQLYQFWKLTQNSSSILMVWDWTQWFIVIHQSEDFFFFDIKDIKESFTSWQKIYNNFLKYN